MDAGYGLSRRWFIATAIAALSSVGYAPAWSGQFTGGDMADAAENTIRLRVIPAFRAVLSPSELAILNSISWEVVGTDMGLFDTYATTHGSQRVIRISAAMADLAYILAYDYVLALNMGMMEKYASYLPFVRERIGQNQQIAVNGGTPRIVPRFKDYARLSLAAIEARIPNPSVLNQSINLTIDSLAYIFGHELGHHVNHDVGQRAPQDAAMTQRQREARADAYSVKLCLRAGLNPAGAVPLLALFATFGAEPTHPPPNCRLADLLFSTYRAEAHDAEFRHYLEQIPAARAKWNALSQTLEAVRSALSDTCH